MPFQQIPIENMSYEQMSFGRMSLGQMLKKLSEQLTLEPKLFVQMC